MFGPLCRSAYRAARRRSATWAAYFSDQVGFVYSVNAATGALLWRRKVDEHPLVRLTGSPTLYNGRLYVPTSSYEEGGRPAGYPCCTFRGSLLALDAQTGDVVWQTFTIPQKATLVRQFADGAEEWGPSGGAIWSAPTVDVKRGAIYVGVGNAYSGPVAPTTDAIVALDLQSGAMRWSRQMAPGPADLFGCRPGEVNCGDRQGPDFDFGASPVLARRPDGRDLLIAGQKSGVVYALDPDKQGQQVWRYRAGGGSGPRAAHPVGHRRSTPERAYVPVAEDLYALSRADFMPWISSPARRAW